MTPPSEKAEKPSPPAASPPLNSGETVAPDQPQSELVIDKLEDLLRKNQVTPQLEKDTGMSREQMEQFVRKFRGAPKTPTGPGREIQVKPGESRKFNPNRALPKELGPSAKVSTKTLRERGGIVQDQIRDNAEGTRYSVPFEYRSKFEGYQSTLSRTKSPSPARSAPGSGSGGR